MRSKLKRFKVNIFMTDVEQIYVDAFDETGAEERAKEIYFASKYRRDCDLVDFEVASEADDDFGE